MPASQHGDISNNKNPPNSSVAESAAAERGTTPPKKGPGLSELATQLRDLQLRNDSQSSEISRLKRRIRLLSEFHAYAAEDGGEGGSVRRRRESLEAKEEAEGGGRGLIDEDVKMNQLTKKGGDDDARGGLNSTGSADSEDSPAKPFQQSGSTKYDHLTDSQLEEFAKVASPKVSELLKEQALALDHLMDNPWSDGDDGSSNSDDYDSDDHNPPPPPDFSTVGGNFNTPSRGKRRGGRRKGRADRRLGGDGGDDEDSVEEEWGQLEAAQLDLKDELNAATNGFAQMLYGNDDNETNCDFGGVDYHTVNSPQHSRHNNQGAASGAGPKTQSEEWRDSIHQFYTDNAQSLPVNANNAVEGSLDSYRRNDNYQSPLPAVNPDHSYTLAAHALTLTVSRPDRGLYVKPWLSRHELETLDIVKLPSYIARPSGEVSSRGRELYMKRMLDCTVEYIEPVKSRNLRRLFSGWVPGPGERKVEDEGVGERLAGHRDGDGAPQRVMAYSPGAKDDEDDDSSAEEEGVDNFEDIEGYAYHTPSRQAPEPLPVRTVTVRIRPDVLCGAVMDALTTGVERAGGEMTKRQGGHLRAVLPGRKMRVWKPGERHRENESIDENNVSPGGGAATIQRGEINDNSSSSFQPVGHENADDDASVTSGISSMLSLSPMLGGGRSSKRKGPTYDILPPTIVDTQLVTKKVGKECQRLVLIRIYRVQDVARASMMSGGAENDEETYDVIAPLDVTAQDKADDGTKNENNDVFEGGRTGPSSLDPLLESKHSLRTLMEASALVQRIKAVGGSGFAIDPPTQPTDDASQTSNVSYLKSIGDALASPIRYLGGASNGVTPPTKTVSGGHSSSPYPTVMELMSRELLQKHVPSPSVGTTSRSAMTAGKQRSHGLFPALSVEDVPYVKSSWIFLRSCVEELDRRRLAYSTLGICPLFQYPALPTLDVHFVAQIKAFCRESMIVSLVKTASELEIYAREFEVSCGNVEQLLRPTFEIYRLAPPQLPMPVPLTAYPLDFRAPEEISPPWGPEVMAALAKISNDLAVHSMGNTQSKNDQTKQNPLSSFERSEKAVSIVVSAFQRQNDVEQGARLGRKNMQVMDRLAKMQAHKRNSIAKIRGSYGKNLLATKAADEFHALRRKSSNVGSLSDVIHADRAEEVPLLTCNVLVGNAAGSCHVTNSHVLFNTQLLPILGGSKVHLFSILDVEVTINSPSKSMLSPLPASISLTTAVFGGSGRKSSTTREEVYNFIPSIGARRFAKFLEVLRDVALEDPNSLKFSEKGGLIYLAD